MRNHSARLRALEEARNAGLLSPAAVRWLFDDDADQDAEWMSEDWTIAAMAADWYAAAEDLANETRRID